MPPASTRAPQPPVPRAVPKPEPKVARAIPVADDADTSEFAPIGDDDLDEASDDINLATGDFESIDKVKKPGPPRP